MGWMDGWMGSSPCPGKGWGAPRAVCRGPEGWWWGGVALRGDGGSRAQGRLRSWAGGAGFGDMGSAPIVTLGGGGQKTHSLTATRSPSHSRVFTSKEHLPFVRSSFQLIPVWTTQTLGHFGDATGMGNTEPPHIPLTAGRAQLSLPQAPLPCPFRGSPGAEGQRPGPAGSVGWRDAVGARGHEHHPVGSGRSCRGAAATAAAGEGARGHP